MLVSVLGSLFETAELDFLFLQIYLIYLGQLKSLALTTVYVESSPSRQLHVQS